MSKFLHTISNIACFPANVMSRFYGNMLEDTGKVGRGLLILLGCAACLMLGLIDFIAVSAYEEIAKELDFTKILFFIFFLNYMLISKMYGILQALKGNYH